jgi:hypothetical protein
MNHANNKEHVPEEKLSRIEDTGNLLIYTI